MKTAIPLVAALLLVPSAVIGQDATGWDSPNAIRPEQQRVEVKDRVEIAADVPGKITELKATARGDTVSKGDIVVRLNSSLVEAQLKEAEAKANSNVLIEYADKSLDAAKFKLQTKQGANKVAKERNIDVPPFSADEIRQLELEVIKGEAELAKSKEDKHFAGLARDTKNVELEQYYIKAEIGGIVTDTHKRAVGSAVRQGDPILTVVNLEEVFVVLTVSPKYESQINIGDKVLVRRVFADSAAQEDNSGGGFLRRKPVAEGSATPTSLPAAQNAQADVKTFVGEITYIGSSQKNEANLMEIEAVVRNELAGPGKYWLREGANIDAVILPAK